MSQESWGEPRSKTVTWYDPLASAAAGATMSGLEYLERMVAGELPRSPIAALVGMTTGSVSDGEVEFRCVPDESTYNPIGLVHGGLLCTLLDSVTGCAVLSTLPAGWAFTSLEIKASYLRAVRAGDELTARGRVTRRGRRVSFADGEIHGPDGKLVATASSTCLVFEL